MDQLECRDRVVRMPALELGQHSRAVRSVDVGQLREDNRSGNKPLLANQGDGVQDLVIERARDGEWHKQAPLQ